MKVYNKIKVNEKQDISCKFEGSNIKAANIIGNLKLKEISDELDQPIILNGVKLMGFRFSINSINGNFFISVYSSYSNIPISETTDYDIKKSYINIDNDNKYIYIDIEYN